MKCTPASRLALHALPGLVPVLLLLPSTGVSQEPVRVVAGQKVRVLHECVLRTGDAFQPCPAASSRRDIGRFKEIRADTLWIEVPARGTEVAIPRTLVTSMWVAEGTKGHFWTGAAIGFVAGGFIGGIVGATQEFCILSCGPATEIGIILGVPAGFVVGGIVGAMIKSDRWRPVDVRFIN